MSSFSNLLKEAQESTNDNIMTLSLENEPVENLITAYSEEEYEKIDGYDWYDDFNDTNYSTVDANKHITVDPKQVNITKETNSQFIPFKITRYWDGIDLTKMELWIHYVNDVVDEPIRPVNVRYNNEYILFGWLVGGNATQISGELNFEILAQGKIYSSDGQSKDYLWRTKPNGKLNILEALKCRGEHIDTTTEDWTTTVLNPMSTMLNQTRTYAEEAKASADRAWNAAENVDEVIITSSVNKAIETADTKYETIENVKALSESVSKNTNAISDINNEETGILAQTKAHVQEVLLNYYTQEQVDKLFENFDISEQLTGIEGRVDNLETELENFDGLAALKVSYDETTNTLSFFNGEEKIKDIVLDTSSDIEKALVPINEDLQNIHDNIDNLPTTLESDYYKKDKTDELLSLKADKTELNTVKSTADTNKTDIGTLGTKVSELADALANIDTTPSSVYDITYEDNKLTLLENETPKTTVTITGGSGGSNTSSSLKIEYVTKTPLVVTVDDKALITFKFSGTDSSGDAVLEGNATWKVAGNVVATNIVVDGENTFDITDYLTIGSQKVQLSVTDDAGSLVTKTWTVQKIDVRLESTFNDTFTYPLGNVSFAYTPYGAIEKDVHFILDGKEIGTVTTSSSGIPMAYTLPFQEHGSHLLEVYMTASVNNNTIESNHIFKDILWYDTTNSIPVIGCIQQEFTTTQYSTTNIVYTVYDPKTETPEVVIAVDGDVVTTKTLESNTDTYAFRSDEIGEHIITITCGDTVKTIIATITELGIKIEPITAGLVFDFNPVGKSNNDKDRLWTYSGDNGSYAMTVSDNFDWVNGGYQLDENGEQYFCIKAGTSAEIDYRMFADDAKKTGKECKLVFKTTNVAIDNAKFLTCIDDTTGSDFIGVEMFTRKACIYGGVTEYLTLPCVPNKIIELEFNISNNLEAITEICGYENGVSSNHRVYDDSYNFTQNTPKYITLGSDNCDLHIYRFKTYNTSLSARNVLTNFIADARSAEEMLNRYYRNQIYNENSALVAEYLADVCKDLKIIKLEAPYFTNKKSDKVPNSIVKFIHKNGDAVLDNFTVADSIHNGQGTSSDNYGGAARNLEFNFRPNSDFGNNPIITLGDGTIVDKITLTRDSIPVNYLNAKVNVASSNMSTNSTMVKRYNKFNPYKRPFVREDESEIAKIKDTMDFYNGVIFIKESDPDVNTHREFADCDWHFYALCNIGDSKKTDNTRLTDPNDRYECIVEIMDVELPLSDFPAGDEAIATLEADNFDEKGTYGWRYIWEDGTDEENAEVASYCKQKWIDFYKFIVNSTDEEFKAHLGNYMVVDSALYYYLFTTRYTLVDNRAKNSFWHYGWTGEYDEEGNKIRKWDLSMAYDMDTALGLNNYGDLVYRYGYEDTDVMDGTNEEVFRESDSTFFCRLRDLFVDEAKVLYNTLESQGAWSSTTLLREINEWQSQFPEALWLEHIQKLYVDSYSSTFINGEGDPQFLRDMAHGKCECAIEDFETNQEKYMASKYQSTFAASDHMIMRCTVPTGDLVVEPNYKLKLTPNCYTYSNVKYGTQEPIQVKGIPGQELEIPFEGNSADIIDIYSISSMQSVGDLSSCYPATLTVSSNYDLKIKELLVGNSREGYDNTNFTTLSLGTMPLLEVLNIENLSGLVQSQDLSALYNLRELYAHGTNTGGVTFANSGAIEIAELPAITSMTAKNLAYLTNLNITSLDKLTTLTIENCDTIDVKTMLETAPNVNRVRITDINWVLTDTSLLERIYNMSGIDKNGYNTERAVITGSVHVPVIKQQQLADYQEAWSDLEITYDTMIEQFTVTFVNADENHTILEVQYVDKGEDAIDPLTREDNPLSPTLQSTISHNYTCVGWDKSLTSVFGDRTITAVYTESLRKYKIKYVSKGTVMEGYPKEGFYGDNIVYDGKTPTYTGEESGYKYCLFNHWDKSGFLTGDFDENDVKIVNAIYDEFEYKDGAFDGKELSELSPVEIYAMNKLGLYKSVVTDMDDFSFNFGYDYNYNDVDSEVLISEKKVFDGTNYLDTGIQLFDEDKDFVLAIDYKFTNSTDNSVLAQCYQGSGSVGFKLQYNNGVQLKWGANVSNVTSVNNREMIVIRHKKGDTNLYIYNSKLFNSTSNDVEIVSLTSKEFTSTSTLVFGCEKQTSTIFANYAQGEINWAKVWYADLGEDICKKLAVWTHESVTLEACGFNRYYLSDNPDDMCSFSLLASHLLDRTVQWNKNGTNTGGWAESDLNEYLNNRLYEAMPTQIKSLLKQVKIGSSIGNKSSEVTFSDCYIVIPSVKEVDPSSKVNKEPYNSEGTTIPFLNQAEISPKRAFLDGDYNAYWLRSPSADYTSYVWRVDADGDTEAITSTTDKLGVVILLSF